MSLGKLSESMILKGHGLVLMGMGEALISRGVSESGEDFQNEKEFEGEVGRGKNCHSGKAVRTSRAKTLGQGS